MPFLALIQAVASRVIIGLVALLTVFGVGSIAEPPVREPIADSIELPADIVFPDLSTGSTTDPSREKNAEVPEEDQKEDAGSGADLQPEAEEPSLALPETPENLPAPAEPDVSVSAPTPLTPSTINTETQKALVNILCTTAASGPVKPITGSGVVITPNGIVITNAHVAQFFLLENYPSPGAVDCVVRTGSPAKATYRAELLYLAPQWIQEHAEDITIERPTGTGEYDYAFLRITGRTDPSHALPERFPHIPPGTDESDIAVGASLLAAAYPAGFLGGISIQKDLYSVSSIVTVGEKFTFGANTTDLISLGGSVVSQGGSSGGAVVSFHKTLLGIIVTSTQEVTTAERTMRAITLSYVNRSLLETLGAGISALTSGDIESTAASFQKTVAPSLAARLISALEQ